MKATEHINTKAILWIGIIFSILVLVVVCLILGRDLSNPLDLAKSLPMVVSVDLVFWELFRRWIWKWQSLHPWLLKIPNLNGEWVGSIRPNQIDTSPGSIESSLTIKQTLTDIVCIVRTGEMKSVSFIAGFRIDTEQELTELSYSYQSVPKSSVRDRSAMHFGTALLEYRSGENPFLTGEYWTTRESTGELEFRRADSNQEK